MPATYTFSKPYLSTIISHAEGGCEMTTESVGLIDNIYTATFDQEFPEDQYLHLQTFTDIQLVT